MRLIEAHSTQIQPYPTAVAVRAALPTVEGQLEYQRRISALLGYSKDKQLMIADLEAQAALAETLSEAMQHGDVRVNQQKQYEVLSVNTAINSNHVNLWRRLAAIPPARRQEYYEQENRPTRSGLLRWWEYWQGGDRFQHAGDLPDRTFDIILSDPPWRYGAGSRNENHFPTMLTEDICALDVPAAKHCVLYLWTTSSKVPDALDVLDAWGFQYKTTFVWVKDQIGMGQWARQQHELLFVAVKGQPATPPASSRPASVIQAPRRRHSEKPEIVYEIIEQAFPMARKLEMFARNSRPSWESWGNEVVTT